MISIPTKSLLPHHRPTLFLLQPLTPEELPNTGITRLLLRAFRRNKSIEILIHPCWFTTTLPLSMRGTMIIYIVLIPNIPEEPNLPLGQKHCNAESVDRCITEALIVEAARFVEPLKVRFVRFVAPEIQRAYFEVGEKLAAIIFSTI